MDKLKEFWKNFTNTPDSTSLYDKQDIENNKLMAILSYIWILFLLPIFFAKDSKYARYHANQGLVLCVCVTLFSVLAGIFTSVLPFLGVIFWILDIVPLVLIVIGIMNVLAGRARELPIIGGIKIL